MPLAGAPHRLSRQPPIDRRVRSKGRSSDSRNDVSLSAAIATRWLEKERRKRFWERSGRAGARQQIAIKSLEDADLLADREGISSWLKLPSLEPRRIHGAAANGGDRRRVRQRCLRDLRPTGSRPARSGSARTAMNCGTAWRSSPVSSLSRRRPETHRLRVILPRRRCCVEIAAPRYAYNLLFLYALYVIFWGADERG